MNLGLFLGRAFQLLKWPVLVFFVNVFLDRGGVYAALPWIDIPMHFLGGASMAVAGTSFLALLRKQGIVNVLPTPLKILLILSLVGLAAVGWELLEFSVDIKFHQNLQPSVTDTMGDLFFGLLGGFVVSMASTFRKARR